jgi:hypothetical protein
MINPYYGGIAPRFIAYGNLIQLELVESLRDLFRIKISFNWNW